MKMKTAYSYTLLRYVHDVLTGEFVNVGIVLFSPEAGAVLFKTRNTIGRLKGVFPDIDRGAFISSMRAVRRGLNQVAKNQAPFGLFSSASDAGGIARQAVPPDESSLQWSPCGAGITNDLEATLQRLFERFVSRYDTHARNRKTDDDVWRPVRQKLEELHLAQHLQEKSIQGGLDDIVFKHAWKNGKWQVYEPLSFDLADAEGIKTKAREWLGHVSAVVAGGKAEHFKPHFIVGAPSNPALKDAYHSAIAILQQVPNQPEVFEETQVDTLVAQIEDEVRAHNQRVN